MTRIIIVGPAQSGKSTIAKRVAQALDTEAVDTSEAIVALATDYLDRLCEIRGGHWRMNTDALYDVNRKRPHRDILIALGDALKTTFGPTILADYCFARGDICCGVRRQDELDAILDKYENVLVVGVETDMPTAGDNYNIHRLYGRLAGRRKETFKVFNKEFPNAKAREAHFRNLCGSITSFRRAFFP